MPRRRPRGADGRSRALLRGRTGSRNRFVLKELLESALAAKSADAWWRLLNAAGVPAGPVYTVPQALTHPQVSERGMIATFPDAPGVGRDIRVLRTGIKLNHEAPAVDAPPPRLGEHSEQILAELGYTGEEIETLEERAGGLTATRLPMRFSWAQTDAIAQPGAIDIKKPGRLTGRCPCERVIDAACCGPLRPRIWC